MTLIALHIEIPEEHPAYQWAKSQSDSVNALGHIGTHIDCYTASPSEKAYNVEVAIFDCTKEMPSASHFADADVAGKAVILYTGVLESTGYGSDAYGRCNTFLEKEALTTLLANSPAFIMIDACGIGNHGEEHKSFDKQCEKRNCFVIENVLLTKDIISSLRRLHISIDLESPSTGKRCQVLAECDS